MSKSDYAEEAVALEKTGGASKSNEHIVSVCALVLSLVSIFVSGWQLFENKRQAEFLISPHLSIRTQVGNFAEEGIYLDNGGFGPAKVLSFKVYFSEQEFADFAGVMTHLLENKTKLRLWYGLDEGTIDRLYNEAPHATWKADDVIPANYRGSLLVTQRGIMPSRITSIQFYRKVVGVKIQYCSMSGANCKWACLNRECQKDET
ncbi:hypothetical protein [Rheinheimera sp. SA_1]|uniref:hypothetical protein n=1 Tax=Rheinheimera sp. SA_1 TaxID=1827365 RepID=UPI000B2BE8E9|nr:hypothetical protein [Rheinheimera sp. SA_1]